MMRKRHVVEDDKQESEEELTLQQMVVQAIMQNRLMNVISDIGQMSHVFRFHPLRFLELLKVSKALNNAVARAERNGGAFAIWYKMCLYSFPDYVIALKACDYDFLPKTGFEVNYAGEPSIPPAWCDFDLPDIETRGVYRLLGFEYHKPIYWTNSAMEKENVRYHDTDSIQWALWRECMDRTFSSQETRRACLQSHRQAQNVAQYFHFVFPVSVPPAEYCMASAVTRHKLAMEFLHLLCDTEGGTSSDTQACRDAFDSWVSTMQNYCMLVPQGRSLKKFYRKDLLHATVEDFGYWHATQGIGDDSYLPLNGLGPAGKAPMQNARDAIKVNEFDPDVSIFTSGHLAGLVLYASRRLRDLMKSVSDPVDKARLSEKVARCRSLYERCALAWLRYAEAADDQETIGFDSKYHSDYTESMFPTPFTTTHDWRAERAADLELYGSHNPLYWDVLLCDLRRMEDYAWVESLSPAAREILARNNQHASELYSPPGAWKQTLLDLLNMFVPAGTTSEEYQRLSSPMPASLSLQCAHCSRPEPGIAKIQAPFRAYCDKACQLKAVLATQ